MADDERPARSELRQLLEEYAPGCTFQEAASGEEAIDAMSSSHFDILFIDINLGDMLGTTVASAAAKLQPGVPVIFATAYSDYAVKAFELGAVDYLLKPFDPDRVAQAMERLHASASPAPAMPRLDKLPLNCNKKIIFLSSEDIIYIETSGRGSVIHTRQGDYDSSVPIGNLEQRLAGHSFFRIHKSFLVNLEYVNAIFPWQKGSYAMSMNGFEKEILPIGRPQFKVLRVMFAL